ncbi:hypothetical protein [Mycolicibacterium sp. A43C]
MDWHAGRLSSRRLLVLLANLKGENGPYARALREGNWPEWMTMLKELHKELALYRASWYVGKKSEYIPKVFLDPLERLEAATESAEHAEFQAEVDQELEQIGWS